VQVKHLSIVCELGNSWSILERSFWLLAHIYILYVEFERKLCQNKNGCVEK